MNTQKFIFLIFVCFALMMGCNKNDMLGDEPTEMELKNAQVKTVMVTVPFKADFIGNYLEGTGPNTEKRLQAFRNLRTKP